MTFVDRIGEIVSDVRDEWDTVNVPVQTPYYLYGHPREIFLTLSEKDESETFKHKKYPLIALFQDFEEETIKGRTTVKNVTIVIMTETSVDYKATNRYTNTFTPTLIPLYELLIEKMKASNKIASDDRYTHDKFDRLYWGTGNEQGNISRIGNDALDAVVISGLNLRILNCNT